MYIFSNMLYLYTMIINFTSQILLHYKLYTMPYIHLIIHSTSLQQSQHEGQTNNWRRFTEGRPSRRQDRSEKVNLPLAGRHPGYYSAGYGHFIYLVPRYVHVYAMYYLYTTHYMYMKCIYYNYVFKFKVKLYMYL